MVLMQRLISWQRKISPGPIPATSETVRTIWLVRMTATVAVSACYRTVVNGLAVLIADVMRHPITTTHEVLRDESDDHEQWNNPIHDQIPIRAAIDYRPL